MKNSKNLNHFIMEINPKWYLLIGVTTILASHMSFSIDVFGWIASVPFLLYLNLTAGWKSRLLFVFVLILSWSFVVLKIVTPPIPPTIIFLFSIPISLFHLPAYLIWDRFKHHRFAVLLFPSVFVIIEWIQYTFTPFASWGSSAYTQSHSPIIMQSVSLFGMAGLSFLIYWVNGAIAYDLLNRRTTNVSFQLPAVILVMILIYGSLRLDIGKSKGRETITVAAVGTDSEVAGLPLPSLESNEKVVDNLFERTRIASKGDAKIVVWNEAAFFALQEDEPNWINKIKALAKECGVSIFASYVVPVSEKPFKYENKFQFISPKGEVVYSYLKHEPVAGEPAVKGKEPLQVVQVAGSNVGGAICYDYDFPYLAKGYGKLNADIVAVPSSDWRGIDPLHTRMAAYRAIEQGHSVIRSTRFGLSAAISPYGEMISQMSSFDNNSKIMMADLPMRGTKTIYAIIGDLFVVACVAFVLFFLIEVLRKYRKRDELIVPKHKYA